MADLYNDKNSGNNKSKSKINKTIITDEFKELPTAKTPIRQPINQEEKFELNFNKPKREPSSFSKPMNAFDEKDVFSSDNEAISFSSESSISNDAFSNSNPKDTAQQKEDFNKQMQMRIAQNIANKNNPNPQQRTPVSDPRNLTSNQRVPTGKPVVTPNNERLPVSDNKISNNNSTIPVGAARVPTKLKIDGQATQDGADLPPIMPNINQNSNNNNQPKKRKGSKKNVFGIFMILVLLLILSAGAYGYSILGNLTYDSTFIEENQYIDSSELFSSDSLINILFLGSDERADDSVSGSRSDTMMLCTIDTENKEIKLTSFLRDSYVYIPSIGYSTKLNAAFAYGGAQGVIDTLEYNFKVDIDQYVMVDFETFELLIDLLGGITVDDVTEKEATYMNDVVKISDPLEAGTNIMDGNTALWYCRIRYLDSDFYRTERQRKVIESIIDKVTETNIFDLIEIVEEVLPNVSTNITQNELMKLAFSAILYMNYDVSQMQIPADGTWYNSTISSQAVLVMDIEENAWLLQEFLTSDTVTRETEDTEDD